MAQDSITRWIHPLKSGDEFAAAAIWERFFQRLREYARAKLGTLARRAQDDEDLALSALHALCIGAREGRFRQLDNRHDIWQILMMIAARKASNVRRRIQVQRERGESDIADGNDTHDLAQLFDSNPSADFFDSLNLHCDELLGSLDAKLRDVALLKLSGHSNQEIAKLRGRGITTIERYLRLIRQIWSEGDERPAS